MSPCDWEHFLISAVAVLEKLATGKSSDFVSASQFFESSPMLEGELRQFLVNSVWEAAADWEEFEELVDFLKCKPSQVDLIQFMNQES